MAALFSGFLSYTVRASEVGLFDLGSTDAAPGQSEVVLTLTITPGNLPVVSWSMVLGYDPCVMMVTDIAPVRPSDFFTFFSPEVFTEQGRVAAMGWLSRRGREDLYVTQEAPVVQVHLCVFKTAAPGAYAVTFLPSATGRPHVGPAGVTTDYTDTEMGVFSPQTQSGTVVVSGEK